ncbi:MAG: M15 family metallopeptidase [Clostridiales bacterium]|nr:M15 family metallopeptidase [Clostridiales bacterium]
MSDIRRTDPYHKLLRIVIVLLVLFVALLVGYFLIDSQLQGKYIEEQSRIVEENNAMVKEYNDAVLARRSQVKPDVAANWPTPKQEGMDVVSLKGFAVKAAEQVPVTRAEALKGGLLLLNRWHALPNDFSIVEGDIDSIMTLTDRAVPSDRREISMFPVAIEALQEMIKAAKAEGLEDYLVRSAYRTMETQTGYWQAQSDRLSTRYTGDILTEEIRKTVAYPGTSDYQSGMSVELDVWNNNDPILKEAKIFDTAQGKWLLENSWKYGFVFRYPVSGYPAADTVDKSYKTGIDLKLDTFRYVGVAHAAVMHHLDLSLEEYIEYLIDNEHIAVYEDGELAYEIFRVEAEPTDVEVGIPAGTASYAVSSDNMDGLVVAVEY